MADLTPYQQKIVKRYYDTNDARSTEKLAELVSDLYLATGKKRQRVWVSLATAMQKLGVDPARIEHLVSRDDPKLVADLVSELEGK